MTKPNNMSFTQRSNDLLPRGVPRKRRFQMTQAEFDKEHARLTLKRESINALSAELAVQWDDLIRDTEIVEETK